MFVEVSAIDEYGVTVKFENAPEEDTDDVTIEVLDNKGNVVAVKPVTVAAEETEVTFDFEKTQEDQEGVWTIGGVEWDFDLIANLAKFKDDLTQVELNKVLEDLGIENVKVKNVPTYKAKKAEFLANLEGDLTVEAIQNWVNKINNETLTKEEDDAIVKEVEDVRDNDILLLPVLEKYFERVNPDWIANYDMSAVEEGTTTVKDIQTIINNANNGELKGEDAVKEMFIKKDLLEARELIEKYATPELDKDKNEVQSDDTKKALKAIEIQLAVVDVREATTPTRLKSALTKLDEVVAKDDKFMAEKKDAEGKVTYKGYVDANAKRYFDQKTDEKTNDFKIIKTAKGETDSAEALIKKVNGLVDEEAGKINKRLVKDNMYLKVTEQERANRCKTLGYTVRTEFASLEDRKDLRGIEIELYKGKELLSTLTLKDYKEHVASEKLTIDGTFDVYGDYDSNSWAQDGYWNLTDIPTKAVVKVKFANGDVAEVTLDGLKEDSNDTTPFFVEAVNRAETAEEMSAALVNLEAKKGSSNAFANLSKAAKLEVAESVLTIRNKEKGIDGLPNTAGKFFENSKLTYDAVFNNVKVTEYNTFISEVNKVVTSLEEGATAEITKMVEKLTNSDFLPEFDKLSAAEKTNKAELVLDKLVEMQDAEKPTVFKTIAEIKAAAGL